MTSEVVSGGAYSFTFTNFQNVNITVTKLKDLTGNGQTVDDTPIQGWTVYLWTNGVQGAPQLTGADGTYTWSGPRTGQLHRERGLSPLGWTATSATIHDFGTAVSGGAYSFTFTNFQTGQFSSVSGHKFFDANLNGIWDVSTEAGLSGWTIHLVGIDALSNAVDRTTMTDGNGYYEFAGLNAGTYNVSEVLMAGWYQTAPSAPGIYTLQVSLRSNVTGIDFGNVWLGKIEGYKFFDLNMNAIKNPGEAGLAGWTITLTGGGLAQPLTTTTDVNGHYAFNNLVPGTYLVTETLKAGWMNVGGLSGSVTVGPGTPSAKDVQQKDFGNVRLGKIDGYKFFDCNMDGSRNVASEPGLYGWTIRLTGNGVSLTTKTAANGYYSFSNLAPGVYVVTETLKSGWMNTTKLSYQVTVGPGTPGAGDVKHQDFGNVRLGAIDGFKFNDRDMDGKWDCLEMGLKGVTIRLWSSVNGAPGVVIRTTVTEWSGHYAFYNVKPGTYFIDEVIPCGFINTTKLPIKVVIGPGSPICADVKLFVNIGDAPIGPPGHSIGFWKNNFQKDLNSNGKGAQVTKFQLKQYLFAITQKYYKPLSNADKVVFSWLKLTTASSANHVTDSELRNAYNILNIPDSSNMQQKAKAQILSLLLTEQLRNQQSLGRWLLQCLCVHPRNDHGHQCIHGQDEWSDPSDIGRLQEWPLRDRKGHGGLSEQPAGQQVLAIEPKRSNHKGEATPHLPFSDSLEACAMALSSLEQDLRRLST